MPDPFFICIIKINFYNMFFATPPDPITKSKRLLSNTSPSHVMIKLNTNAAPQSPLMAIQQIDKRKKASKQLHRNNKTLSETEWTSALRPVTPKITSTPPLTDFYWGKQVTNKNLTPRMRSLQKGMLLYFLVKRTITMSTISSSM